jgi:hypothetical protein
LLYRANVLLLLAVARSAEEREDSRMKTVGCLRCGVWYDPARSHCCGVLGDDVARRLAERLDAFERRFQGLEVEERSLFNALERRIHELGAARAQVARKRADEDAPSPVRVVLPPAPEPRISPEPIAVGKRDRRADHARYMRQWRLRQALRRGNIHA